MRRVLELKEFGKEVHVYAPAYKDSQFPELLRYCRPCGVQFVFPVVPFQTDGYSRLIDRCPCGIRVNPEHSEVKVPPFMIPADRFSRLGVTRREFRTMTSWRGSADSTFTTCASSMPIPWRGPSMCSRDKFGEFLETMQWVNFGGGHHITRPDYDIDLLCSSLTDFRRRYPLEVYLEPGEAIALNTGVLVASVLDIIHNEMEIAILDTSAAAHMPDVLEMPYRPEIVGAGQPGEYPHLYRLGGLTCLGGRRDRRLLLPQTAGNRNQTGHSGHGTLHHGEKQYL